MLLTLEMDTNNNCLLSLVDFIRSLSILTAVFQVNLG